MGIFDRFYYGRAGKRDYSETDMPDNRFSLFMLVLKDHFFDLIKVNFLQLPFWIPFILWSCLNLFALQSTDLQSGEAALQSVFSGYILTWLLGLIPCIAITGPSTAGAAYVMRNWSKDQHAFLFSDFKDAFRGNWKQALAVSAITSIVPAALYAAYKFYGMLISTNTLMYVPLIATLSFGLFYTLMLPLIYPMMVGYELKLVNIFRNAFLMTAAKLPRMILTRLLAAGPLLILSIGLMNGNPAVFIADLLYYCLIGYSLTRLIYASVANSLFDLYLNPKIEGARVREGLRPASAAEESNDYPDDEESLPGFRAKE